MMMVMMLVMLMIMIMMGVLEVTLLVMLVWDDSGGGVKLSTRRRTRLTLGVIGAGFRGPTVITTYDRTSCPSR
jgi:hypothetical protein